MTTTPIAEIEIRDDRAVSREVRRRMILRQVGLLRLSERTRGSSAVRIALIDGPIARTHPTLAQAAIEEYPLVPDVETADPRHATFIASILVGSGSGVVAIAPACTLLSLVVQDASFQRLEIAPKAAALRIARAIYRAIELKADIIQLSLDFLPVADLAFRPVMSSLNAAATRGICTVVAAGNWPRLGVSAVLSVDGVLPVAMADSRGRLSSMSPVAPSVGHGLRCVGDQLPGALPPDIVEEATGSSFAAAIVSGTIALLKALRPDLSSLAIAACHPGRRNRSMVPPLLDGSAWLEALNFNFG